MEQEAGWYAQAEGGERYWNGKSWTAATRLSAGSPLTRAAKPGYTSRSTRLTVSEKFAKSANFWRDAFVWIAIVGGLLVAISFGIATNSAGLAIGSGVGFALTMLPWVGLFSVIANWVSYQQRVDGSRAVADA